MNQISGLKSHMLSKFRNNLNALKNYKKIVNLDHVINVANPNFLQDLTNYFVEKTLKTARLFR